MPATQIRIHHKNIHDVGFAKHSRKDYIWVHSLTVFEYHFNDNNPTHPSGYVKMTENFKTYTENRESS